MSEQTATELAPQTVVAAKAKTGRKCADCGVRPIDRNTQGRDSSMCTECFDYAGWENQHSDEAHENMLAELEWDALAELTSGCPVCHPELDPRNQPVAEPVAKPKATRLHRCHCSDGCTAQTKLSFAPRHDARLVSLQVKAIRSGEQTVENASALIREAGGSDKLVDKLYRAASR
jgi:hypothetical protein